MPTVLRNMPSTRSSSSSSPHAASQPSSVDAPAGDSAASRTHLDSPISKQSRRPLFLGLDLSTQSLKATFLDDALRVVDEFAVNFDTDLPRYRTKAGVHSLENASGVVTSPVAMWLDAVDILFERIRTSAAESLLSDVIAISGAAQHASVYWSQQSYTSLCSVRSSRSLSDQLSDSFSKHESPNWQDSSTTAECTIMEAAVGGAERMAKITGSRAHERFTGPQILKLRRGDKATYDASVRISLASSFMTTILCLDGEIKSLEESDVCGMNLYNIERQGWDADLMICVGGSHEGASDLERKLGPVTADGGIVVGKIGTYFVERFGFDAGCLVNPFTGDNPATLLASAILPSDLIVSLGTSDTVLLSTEAYAPSIYSHTFLHPANMEGQQQFMGMLCYKNGSLAREYVRDQYAAGDWHTFAALVERHALDPTSLLSREFGFYFLKPEIIPHHRDGFHFFDNNGNQLERFLDSTFNPRAILESQMMSFRLRSRAMLGNRSPSRIFAVGGASSNSIIVSLLSSMMGTPVYTSLGQNSCSAGGAMKAYWGYSRACQRSKGEIESDYDTTISSARGEVALHVAAEPDHDLCTMYGALLQRFELCEKRI